MAYKPSTYQTNPAFANSINNLSSALFGDPAGEAAYAESLGNQHVNVEKVTNSRRNRNTLNNLQGAVKEGNLADALAYAAGTGDSSIMGQMPGYNLARTAANPDVSEQDLARTYVGTGQSIGPNDAFSVEQSEDRLANAFTQDQALYNTQYNKGSASGENGAFRPGDVSTDELTAWYVMNNQPVPAALQENKRPQQSSQEAVTLDPADLETAELMIRDMAPSGYDMDSGALPAILERVGAYYTNAESPVRRDMGSAVSRAVRDVLGEGETSGNWNPFKANQYGAPEGYQPPPLPWDQPQQAPAPQQGGQRGPVQVQSPEEASQLPPDTLFTTPDGRTMRVPGQR